MNPFQYLRAASVDDAVAAIQRKSADDGQSARPDTCFLAGGTNLIDLWKEGVAQPATLIDVGRLAMREIVTLEDGAIALGAGLSNAATANHPLIIDRLPLLRSAILAGASPQIRNRATNGGNLLQRTRCVYFYDRQVPCNKRSPGSGCPAITGLARQHAILGASASCVATHPSDLCVGLAALDARVEVTSQARGERSIPFGEFHRLPGDRPDLDTTLQPDELITRIVVPANGFARHHCYLKVRERSSYAFALVSVAVALTLDERGAIAEARLALGGVAHKPWRDVDAENRLRGRPPDRATFEDCAEQVLSVARAVGGPALPESSAGNAFKIPLARNAIIRAFELALDGITTNTGEDAFRAMGQAQQQLPAGQPR